MAFIDQIRHRQNKSAEANGTRRGYYLVKHHDRHFISPTVNPTALERVAEKVLSERKGWDYWIDYSHGANVDGGPAWENVDCTDSFI